MEVHEVQDDGRYSVLGTYAEKHANAGETMGIQTIAIIRTLKWLGSSLPSIQ